MKLILASTLATASLSFAADPPVGGKPTDTIAIVSPLTAVVITQCNDLISVVVTLADGSLRHFGPHDGLSHDEALRLAEKAKETIQVRIQCPVGEDAT